MGSSTPLLNDYKKDFFWKRFPQTVLGGIKLKLGTCAPAYVYMSQICIWLLPVIYGGLFTLLVELEVIAQDTAIYIAGGMMALSVFIIQIISRVVPLKKTSSVSPEPLHNDANFLSDEDSVEFDSCCGVATTGFVIPPKKYIINIIFHALISAPLVGITVWYLLPSTLSSLFSNTGAMVVLFILGWITLCVAQYSLSIGAPPETAIYRATDNFEICSLTRPFYIFICLNVHITDQYLSGLHQVNQALHVVFVLLPIFWAFGLLPPVDAFFLWLMEQLHIFLLGGSAMASDLRLFLMFLFSGVLFLVVYFALSGGYATVIVLASAGYVLSLDLGGLGSQIIRSCKKKQPPRQEHSNCGFLWHWTWREAIFHVIMTVAVGGLTALVTYLYKEYGSSTPDISSYIGFGVIGVLVLEVVLVDIQKVYVLFGMVRNCFFPTSVMKLEVFRAKKQHLVRLGMVRRIVISFVGPILMLCFLSISFDFTVADNSLVPALNMLGALRAFRWVWQNTSCSLFEVSLAQILISLLPDDSQWLKLGLGVQLILLSVARNRLSLMLDKLYFWFTLTVTFWSDKKQRRKSSPGLIALNFIFFPLVLGLICATALLAAPLLPLFTLPLFFVGYPRPLRFWPGTPGTSQNTCGDTIYYQQVAPQIAQAFHDGFATGSIGETSPGNHYLVRFQDRLVWVQVLEKGFGYCTLSIKGMELQETSCHAVEATKVDDILEETFEVSGGVCCRRNKYLLYTVSPCDVKLIKTYSDAKNQLTGVIDSPDTIKMIQSCFTQTLAWIFLDHFKKLNVNSSSCPMQEVSPSKNRPPFLASNRIARSPSVTSDLSLGRPQSRGAESVNSFVNSMWSDDEDSLLDETYSKKNKVNLTINSDKNAVFSLSPQKLPPVNNIPLTASTKPTLPSSSNVVDNLFKELELGLPANNVKVSNVEPAGLGMEDVPNYNFSSIHSSRIALPVRWTKIPIDEGRLKLHAAKFSWDWFKHILMQLRFESARGIDSQAISKEIIEDKCLVDMYRNLITACYAVIYDLGLSGSESGPSHVYKVYKGNIPWSVASEWITEDKELLSLVLKAFRYAVKLSIDQALLGEVTSNSELQEYMEEYDTQWYIGTETDQEWNESIATGKSQLFSLDHDTEKNIYTSRVLTIQDTPVYISSLNPEAVHAQWANLNLELLYMTNDDEERYSIQAHRTLLRNLNVQSADPPLGYPIYASEPVSVPCL